MIKLPVLFADSADCVVGLLRSSEFNFYQTGSRFFQTFDYNSDWDFFVEESDSVREFLKNNQFYQNAMNEHYGDTATSEVWEGSFKDVLVHIQLVHANWMEHKIKAHDVILEHKYHLVFKHRGKRDARLIWTAILKTLKSLE